MKRAACLTLIVFFAVCSSCSKPDTSAKPEARENTGTESKGLEVEVSKENVPASTTSKPSNIESSSSDVAVNEVDIHAISGSLYSPEIYGVRFGMPMSMVEKILHGNPEIIVIKGEEATPAGRQPRLDYYDPLNIHVRPKDCRPYTDKYIFSGEGKALSRITLTCSDDASEYDFCLDCISPMNFSPEFEELSKERIEYYAVVEKRKTFQKSQSVVFELEHSIYRSDVSGENYTLSVYPLDEYPPRLIVEPLKVITPMNKPVEFTGKGWDPVTGELPKITWEPVVAGEPAESGPQITRLWQEPGTFTYVVKAQGTNGLETEVQVTVDVTNHTYSEDAIDIVEAISTELLFEEFMPGWGKTLTIGGQDVSTGDGQEVGMQKLDFLALAENIEHVVESLVYFKQGKLSGYKLTLRTPSKEFNEIYSSLYEKLGLSDYKTSVRSIDDDNSARRYLGASNDLYLRMKHDAVEDYGPKEIRENKLLLEVLYIPLWEKDEVAELSNDWKSLISKLK